LNDILLIFNLNSRFVPTAEIRPNILIFNPSNTELNPICHLPALLGAHHIFHVSRIRVNIVYTVHDADCNLLNHLSIEGVYFSVHETLVR